MDEKTEELRDIFMDVSDEETVTEAQAETRGSLSTDEGDGGERLREVVSEMRDRYEFDTGFETGTYVRLVRAFYDDDDDAAIADDLSLSTADVFRARMDLHLFRGGDTDGPVSAREVRERGDESAEAVAEEFGVDPAAVRRSRDVVDAQDAARSANYRYQTEFDEILTDAALAGGLTDSIQEDGLDEAAEDIETDVSF